MSKQVSIPTHIDDVKISFNYLGGCYIFSANQICFCKGDGNYTNLFLKDSRKILVSKQLKDVQEKFSACPGLVRVGKSYIINLDNIQKIDEHKVTFNTLKSQLHIKFSPIYLRRVKEQVLWYSY
jgi:DNA-binding LytR/AlgR family response regulator